MTIFVFGKKKYLKEGLVSKTHLGDDLGKNKYISAGFLKHKYLKNHCGLKKKVLDRILKIGMWV